MDREGRGEFRDRMRKMEEGTAERHERRSKPSFYCDWSIGVGTDRETGKKRGKALGDGASTRMWDEWSGAKRG